MLPIPPFLDIVEQRLHRLGKRGHVGAALVQLAGKLLDPAECRQQHLVGQIEEFSRQLTERGADVPALAKAVQSLLDDIEEWRNQ